MADCNKHFVKDLWLWRFKKRNKERVKFCCSYTVCTEIIHIRFGTFSVMVNRNNCFPNNISTTWNVHSPNPTKQSEIGLLGCFQSWNMENSWITQAFKNQCFQIQNNSNSKIKPTTFCKNHLISPTKAFISAPWREMNYLCQSIFSLKAVFVCFQRENKYIWVYVIA